MRKESASRARRTQRPAHDFPMLVLQQSGRAESCGWLRPLGSGLSPKKGIDMSETVDSESFGASLRSHFKEAWPALEELERRRREYEEEHHEEFYLSAYTYVSEVFWWEVFEPALASGNLEPIGRCVKFMELLVGSPDDLVREATDVRITPRLYQWPIVGQLAGPLLSAKLVSGGS